MVFKVEKDSWIIHSIRQLDCNFGDFLSKDKSLGDIKGAIFFE